MSHLDDPVGHARTNTLDRQRAARRNQLGYEARIAYPTRRMLLFRRAMDAMRLRRTRGPRPSPAEAPTEIAPGPRRGGNRTSWS